jgi:hypothetical protein
MKVYAYVVYAVTDELSGKVVALHWSEDSARLSLEAAKQELLTYLSKKYGGEDAEYYPGMSIRGFVRFAYRIVKWQVQD